jgi:hypothetical protein
MALISVAYLLHGQKNRQGRAETFHQRASLMRSPARGLGRGREALCPLVLAPRG